MDSEWRLLTGLILASLAFGIVLWQIMDRWEMAASNVVAFSVLWHRITAPEPKP